MTALVVGAGVAGVAAAFALKQRGVSVTVVSAGSGASALSSGAVDALYQTGAAPAIELSEEEGRFVSVLGGWCFPEAGALLVNSEGVVRQAPAHDRALLDLAGRSATVGCVDLGNGQGVSLAARLGQQFSSHSGIKFVPVKVPGVYDPLSSAVTGYDIAEAFAVAAEPRRKLIQVLSQSEADCFLCGPWLALSIAVYDEICRELGRPIGETMSEVGGIAGARLVTQLQQVLSRLGIRTVEQSASSLARQEGRWHLQHAEGSLEAAGCVLALGGVVAGGVRLDQAHHIRLSLEIADPEGGALWQPTIQFEGEVLREGSMLHGVDFTKRVKGLDNMGVRYGPLGKLLPQIYAAGDLRADTPRTVMEALRSGLCAGRSLADALG